MSIESDADRLDIVRTLAGITKDYISVTHSGGKFEAIFDNDYYQSTIGDGPAIESAQPIITARTIDVADLRVDAQLHIDGESDIYYVKRPHRPDGTGMSVVFLKR